MNGFVWMEELADLLAEYEAQRDQFPSFDSFFPRIVTFFDTYSEQFDAKLDWYQTLKLQF